MRRHPRCAIACLCAAVAVLWSGCGEGDNLGPIGSPPTRAMQEIPDGFDFLPPLHGSKNLTTFNSAATPTVEIYAGSEADKGALLARYETADIAVETDQFQVNWDTRDAASGLPDGTTDCVVEVYWETAGGCDLMGYVDCLVDKAAGKGKKSTDPEDYFFSLTDGRTLPIKFVIDTTVSAPEDLTVTGVDPGSGAPGETLDLTVTGTGFKPESQVTFSGTGITVNSTNATSSTSLTANVTIAADATTGPHDVTVSGLCGRTAVLGEGFNVAPPAPTGGLADSAWPKMLHDAANTSRGTGVGATGSPAWSYQTGGPTMSPAIGLGGVVYVGSDDNGMRALDPDSGSLIWQFNTQFRCSYGMSIGADGTLYFGSLDRHVYAVDGASGTQRWSTDLGGEISSAPAIGPDGQVYVGARNHVFYALDGRTGAVLWTFQMGHDTASSPAIGPDGVVYFGCYDDRLYALDSQTGSQQWAFTASGDIQSSPALADNGRLYFGSWDGNVYCVESSTGLEIWRRATGGAVNSSAAIGGDGRVYIGSQANKLVALEADTGALVWQFATAGGVSSSPAIGGDGTIYVGCDGHRLYAVNSTNGQMIWSYQAGNRIEVCPAVGADGTVYIGSWDGKLHAIR